MDQNPNHPELILIDDDEILLVILEKMILMVIPNCTIKSFATGTAALDYLKGIEDELTPRFLLIDINLKDMLGWEFISQAEVLNSTNFKSIVITSSVSESNPVIAKQYESVIGFFEKPLTMDVIQKIVQLIQSH